MIFFAALVIAVIIAVAYGYRFKSYGVGLVLGLVIGCALYGISHAILPMETNVEVDHYELRAISSGSSSGYYLATNGSIIVDFEINEPSVIAKPVLGPDDFGVIYQDDERYLTIEKKTSHNFWLEPWETKIYTKYEFHIPKGLLREHASSPDK